MYHEAGWADKNEDHAQGLGSGLVARETGGGGAMCKRGAGNVGSGWRGSAEMRKGAGAPRAEEDRSSEPREERLGGGGTMAFLAVPPRKLHSHLRDGHPAHLGPDPGGQSLSSERVVFSGNRMQSHSSGRRRPLPL